MAELSDERIQELAGQAASSVEKLIAFGQALKKVKRGTRIGRIMLRDDECEALLWGIYLLKDRPHRDSLPYCACGLPAPHPPPHLPTDMTRFLQEHRGTHPETSFPPSGGVRRPPNSVVDRARDGSAAAWRRAQAEDLARRRGSALLVDYPAMIITPVWDHDTPIFCQLMEERYPAYIILAPFPEEP